MCLRQITMTVAAGLAFGLLAACGTASAPASRTDSMTALKTSSLDQVPTGVRSQVLPAGDYVVTFQRTEACQSHELNLKKALVLDVPAGSPPELHVSSAGDVHDNLLHPRICFLTPAPSSGTLVLSLTGDTKVTGDDVLIASVARVTAKAPVAGYDAGTTLPAGSYVVDLAGPASCRDVVLNVTKTLHYGANHTLTVELAAAGGVRDDLMHAQVCMPDAHATAAVYLTLATPAELATGGLQVTAVSRVTATEPVALH